MKIVSRRLVEAPCHGYPARAAVLQQTSELAQTIIKVGDILGQSGILHGAVSRVHLHHTRPVPPYGARYLRIVEQFRSGYLVESHLMDEQFVVAVEVSLHHVYLLLDELIGNDVQRRIGDLGLRKNPDDVRRLLRSYSRNIATQASKSLIRRDLSSNEDTPFNEDTLDKYLELLDTMYITDDLEPWAPSVRSKVRVQGMKTRHLSDPSLAVASLGLSPEVLIKDFRTFGFLFESYVIRDLRVYSSILNGRLYHYRDSKGLEADAVMELRDHRWAMFEVKLFDPARVDEGAANLLKIKDKIDTNRMNEPSFMMVITAGKYARQRADGVYEVPVSLLAP